MNNKIVISVSGGMDSTTVLSHYINLGFDPICVHFQYGSKHNQYELKAIKDIVKHYDIKDFRVIDMTGIFSNMKSNLMKSGGDIPEGHYASDNMSLTVIPGRNTIFAAVMGGIAESEKASIIALGTHLGDHCLPGSTKIYTPNGMRQIKNIKAGDIVFSSDHGVLVESKVNSIWEKGSPDQLLEIKTGKHSQAIRMTDEHKVYAILNKGRDSSKQFNRELKLLSAKELKEGDFLLQPTSSNLIGSGNIGSWVIPALERAYPDRIVEYVDGYICMRNARNKSKLISMKFDIESLYELLAWYVCEGWTGKVKTDHDSKFQSAIAQKYSKNALETETIYELISKLIDIPRYNVSDSGTGDEWSFNISGVLSAICQLCGTNSYNKHIPSEMFTDLIYNEVLRGHFLSACMEADGHKLILGYRGESYSYASVSIELIDQVSILSMIHGAKIIREPKLDNTNYVGISFKGVKSRLCQAYNNWLLPVTSIDLVDNDETVWDMEIDIHHNYIANSYVVSNSIYPDCRPEFIESLDVTIDIASDGIVRVEAPFITTDKIGICNVGIDLKTPYHLTRTCYKDQPISCGKCGSCVERLSAFAENNATDPIDYIDREYYIKVIDEFNDASS